MARKIKIGVADFALPVPRIGSIEANSGFGINSLAQGLEIHQKLQFIKAETDTNYLSEIKISQTFQQEHYTFEVSGRIDGMYRHAKVMLEEIKSSFDVDGLHKALLTHPDSHPYCLQLKTYGYFYWLQHEVVPDLSFCLVSARNNKILNLTVEFDIPQYELWLQARLQELVLEVKATDLMIQRRKKIGAALAFPFAEPRVGQMDLIATVAENIQSKKFLLLQAPTGVGKTIGVMYPVLQDALNRGQKAIYLTPKNSQHQVAEDAVLHLKEKIKLLTITAKNKMCLKPEPICDPKYCEYAKDHYTKVFEKQLMPKLAKKKLLSSYVIKKFAKANEVCPYEIQFAAVKAVDVVVCDYNYVFSPRATNLQEMHGAIGEKGKPNLIIDEIHNLPNRGMDYYSSEINVGVLDGMALAIKAQSFAQQQQKKVLKLVKRTIEIIQQSSLPNVKIQHKIILVPKIFDAHAAALKEVLAEYLATDVVIEAENPVLKFIYYCLEFIDTVPNAGRAEFFASYNHNPSGIKIVCCDASLMLQENYKNFANVIGFSATLKPFEYYGKLTGLDSSKVNTAEFISPFPKDQRKILIIPQIFRKW